MLIDLLELASNNVLEYDPKAQARLVELQGKTMTLTIRPIDQSLSVTPYPQGLEFASTHPGHTDVTLSATVSAMIKITRDGMNNAHLQPGELEIIGDPIVGQRFAQILAELNIDWEALLAEQIGDSPARVITFAATQAKELALESQTRFKQFIGTLFKEDLALVADKQEVETFLDDVDTVRADTDRLMSRIKRLQSKMP